MPTNMRKPKSACAMPAMRRTGDENAGANQGRQMKMPLTNKPAMTASMYQNSTFCPALYLPSTGTCSFCVMIANALPSQTRSLGRR